MDAIEFIIEKLGTLPLIVLVFVCFASFFTVFSWRRYSKLDLPFDTKRLFLMQWPRMLSGLGVIGVIIGLAEFVGTVYKVYFFSGSIPPTPPVIFWTRALVPIFSGGLAFFVTWSQYGIYLKLLDRMEAASEPAGAEA